MGERGPIGCKTKVFPTLHLGVVGVHVGKVLDPHTVETPVPTAVEGLCRTY